ncbi:MAG: TIGR02281 family clan AA aspartic protease [Candidatus Omnitrophica bacterium]|nr:TIGR02281 family clan AA aspartic protease [Candidatus Omnitrophota bacterium]
MISEKNAALCGIAILSSLFLCAPLVGFADVIYLKNGRSLEGIVEKEDENSVVVNIGAGTTTLYKTEIDHIQRDSTEERKGLEKEWGMKYFANPEFTPSRFQDLAADFRRLEQSRLNAVKSKRERDNVLSSIGRREDDLEQLRQEILPYNEKIGEIDPDENVRAYNEAVSKYNSLANQIQEKLEEVDDLKSQLQDFDKKILAYSDNLNTVTSQFRQALKESKGKLTEKEQLFLQLLQVKIEQMREDFTAVFVNYRQDETGIVVNVLLNETLSADFVVDTGATLVVLAEHIANKIGIFPGKQERLLSITLGDGREVDAYPVVLESVKVGQAEVKNVRAAVLLDVEAMDIDGLLGMSFLEHFAVKIDGKSKKLILEELGL